MSMVQLVMLIMCSCNFSELERNEDLALILMKWCEPKDDDIYNKLDYYLYQKSVNFNHQKLVSLLESYSIIKNKLFNIANMHKCSYSLLTLSKISKLALVGYVSNGVQSLWDFFVRNISMRSHFMAKLGRDTSKCVGIRLSLSTNPFQLCHPHLVVNGKAPLKSNGAH